MYLKALAFTLEMALIIELGRSVPESLNLESGDGANY